MSQDPKPDPNLPAGNDLGKRILDAATSEPIPERIVNLAKDLDAALKAKAPTEKTPRRPVRRPAG